MDIESLKPNSHKYNLEKKDSSKINKKGQIIKGKSTARRLSSLFLSEDIGNVKEYIIYDILIPTIKDGLFDILNRGTEMLFYGKARGKKGRFGGEYYSYNQCSNKSKNLRDGSHYTGRISVNDIGFEERWIAEEKKEELEAIFDRYHKISVADVFDVAEVTGNGSVDHEYGWYSLKDVSVERCGDKYTIIFPRPIQLD